MSKHLVPVEDRAPESVAEDSFEVVTNDKALEIDSHCESKREARDRRQELMDAGYNAYVRRRHNPKMVVAY